ncbi:glycosyl hydrolase [Nitrosomonas sp. Is37]|uniref:glycosyl hydrolase n=1 Tax=Nitrosomonas sp. Is37 TaxID=3080535 RepID=UPI00294AB461|nr:glycosyl hydrolase [Nitrosomonas sp. Is37]
MKHWIVINITLRFIWSVIALLLAISASFASDKKGVGLANLQAPERIVTLNVAWYYTWKPQPIDGAPIEKFVPMIWGRKRLDVEIAEMRANGKVPILLGFNEPNKVDQSNMSVQKAVREWTRLEPLADRLGSPAPAGVLGPWFERFYHEVRKKKLKVDFMAVHLYSPPDPQKFLAKIDAVYEKYRMPIWITEFAVADWNAKNKSGSNRYSEEEVLAFMKAVLPELEKRPYIERYAWFGAGNYSLRHEEVRTSRLFEKDGTLTPLGRFYSEFQ